MSMSVGPVAVNAPTALRLVTADRMDSPPDAGDGPPPGGSVTQRSPASIGHAIAALPREQRDTGTATGDVALTPNQVRNFVPGLIAEGRRLIEENFGRYGAAVPADIRVEYLTSAQATAQKLDPNSVAQVDPDDPKTMVVIVDHPYFAKGDVDRLQYTIVHELLHLSSMPYSARVQSDGLLLDRDKFTDGTETRWAQIEGVTELLAERLTGRPSPLDYGKERLWAQRIVDTAGDETVLRAYFANDDQAYADLSAAKTRVLQQDIINSGQVPPIDLANPPAAVAPVHVQRVFLEAKLDMASEALQRVRERLIDVHGTDAALYGTTLADYDAVEAALAAVFVEARSNPSPKP
jgi:hypothetical protein